MIIMTKNEYLQRLRTALSGLSADEMSAAMSYYEEFFEDAGAENESAVISSLGSPEKLAQTIKSESSFVVTEAAEESSAFDGNDYNREPVSTTTFTPPPTQKTEGSKRSTNEIILIIVILVLTSPLWIGLVTGLIGGLFGISVAAVTLVCVFCGLGVVLAVVGLITLFFAASKGLMVCGAGLIMAGLGWLLFVPLFKGVIALIKWLVGLVVKGFNLIIGKKGVEA